MPLADDELSSCTGYHNALPMEVHGAGYTQMHMISNTKAEKLVSSPHVEALRGRKPPPELNNFLITFTSSACPKMNILYLV